MRHRSSVRCLPCYLCLFVASFACGGVPFEEAPAGADAAGGLETGPETSTITVNPPDGAAHPKDAAVDSTTDASGAPPDAHSDAEADAGSTDASADAAQPIDSGPDSSAICKSTEKLCGSGCVPLTNPDTGCGAASCSPCNLPNATNVCGSGGACAVGTCDPGFADCTASPGCETDITTATNCGKCGGACTVAAPYCVPGGGGYACGDNCPVATPTLCGATCVDEQTDPNHCGSCPKQCTGAGANATNECVASACKIACNNGYSSCNAACVNYTNDNNNCGSCGHACASVTNGSDTCGSSTCTVTCNPSYKLCTVAGVTTCVAPDAAHAVFVSPSSITSGCGSIAAPCGTIAAGIAAAQAQGKTKVYLDGGTYAEHVTLTAGIALVGGWTYSGGGVWSKAQCAGIADPSALTILQPTSGNVTVTANNVTATLDTLTVKSIATAGAGQSLYGIFATTNANLTLNAVEVSVAAGGPGSAGGTGTAPANGQTVCSAPPENGNTGAPPLPAKSPTSGGSYSIAGYAPMTGGPGNPGNPGDNGTPGGAPSTWPSAACDLTSTTCNSGSDVAGNPGTSGCGGPGGGPGLGGNGGGSSIGVFAWQSTVHITGGALTASGGGAGGGGGGGGKAATSWPTMNGAVGAPTSVPYCTVGTVGGQPVCLNHSAPRNIGGAAGGAGGAGSTGSVGASGSGGDSYAYYAGGGGLVQASGTTATCGSAGTSPGPIAGVNGGNGSGSCHN